MNWKHLTTNEQLDGLDELSKSSPVLIFKHSTRCSISAAALNRLERNWDDSKIGKIETCFLDLIRFRELSETIATRYGITHESPQVLLIENGKCDYTNSHLGISFEDLIEHTGAVSA